MDPFALGQVDPSQAILGGLKIGHGITQLEQQRTAQMQAQQQAQQMQGALRDLAMRPSSEGFVQAMTMFPQLAEHLKKPYEAWDAGQKSTALNAATRAYAAIQSGKPQLAVDMMRQYERADPNNAQHWGNWASLIEQAPQQAQFMGGLMIAGLSGDKFKDVLTGLGGEVRAEEKRPAELLGAQAEATKKAVEARYAEDKAVADLGQTEAQIAKAREDVAASRAATSLAARRFGLDQERFNLEYDKALEEHRQKRLNGGVTLSAGMEKLQADSVGAALTAKSASDQAVRLADVIRRDPQSGGWASWTANKWREVTGSDSPMRDVRNEYARIRNQGLLADLPPGPASDRDISLMKEGFPSENADGEVLARWLDSFGRVQKAVAQREEAKADWLSAVGALKTAPRDIEVMGVKVPAGTSFNDFMRRGLKQDGAAPGARTGYMQKYGGGATGSF